MPRSRSLAALSALSLLVVACGSRTDEPSVEPDGSTAAPTTVASDLPASDVGVTPTEIVVGHIVTRTSPMGSETFAGPTYGVEAFFQALNARGGINGRRVRVVVCDDEATGVGNRNCVRKLVDDEKVFAFVGNSILDYAGAEYVNEQGVPDIGGQPIDNAYDSYQHLFNIYGSNYPRDGEIGFDGELTTSTEIYRYFKAELGATKAAVVAYNQSDSLRYGNLVEAGLKAEGFDVIREQVDFAVPNFDAIAIDLRDRGIDIVFDAMDVIGNVALCRALDGIDFQVRAKVSSVQSWTETVRDNFSGAPKCRNSLYATSRTRNYMDTQIPIVAQAREEIAAAFPDREDRMSIWTLDGWGAAKWFTDAALSCGADLTRGCVETFMNRPVTYDAGGLFDERIFTVRPPGPSDGSKDCLSVAKWDDAAYDGNGGWVSQTPGGEFVCYTDTPSVTYRP